MKNNVHGVKLLMVFDDKLQREGREKKIAPNSNNFFIQKQDENSWGYTEIEQRIGMKNRWFIYPMPSHLFMYLKY